MTYENPCYWVLWHPTLLCYMAPGIHPIFARRFEEAKCFASKPVVPPWMAIKVRPSTKRH